MNFQEMNLKSKSIESDMLRKSDALYEEIMSKIPEILINPNEKPYFKGSFFRKKNGDIVTDIDVTQFYGERKSLTEGGSKLINDIQRVINAPHFKFMSLRCGLTNLGKTIPWVLTSDGDLHVEWKNVKSWLELLPPKYAYIKDKLLDGDLSVADLMKWKKILDDEYEINWTKEEIMKDEKIIDGKPQKLSQYVRRNKLLMKFIYEYDGHPIVVESAIGVGWTYNYLIAFCTRDMYKILKHYRRYLEPDKNHKYFEIVNSLDPYIYVLSQMKLAKNYPKIQKIVSELCRKCNVSNPDTCSKQDIQNALNRELALRIHSLDQYLQPQYVEQFKKDWLRSDQAQLVIPRQLIKTLYPNIFVLTVEEVNALWKSANVSGLAPERVVNCALQTAIDFRYKGTVATKLVVTIIVKNLEKIKKQQKK